MAVRRLLLVDAYNVMHALKELKPLMRSDLQSARVRFVDMLADYAAYRDYRVIAVFDAHQVAEGVRHIENNGDISVVYTAENERADHYIERFVSLHRADYEQIYVVSSDGLIQSIVLSLGALRVSAREFCEQMRAAREEYRRLYVSRPLVKPESGRLSARLDKNMQEELERLRRGD